jgi:alpha-glucosidase
VRGTPFLYYGEEIGMRDVEVPAERALDPMRRDRCRTPMQWSAQKNGGFSDASQPWLPVGDYDAVNVERQSADPRSLLSLYRRLIRLRRATPALVDGSYRTVANAPEDCLVFIREQADQRVLVAVNFSEAEQRVSAVRGKLVLSSEPDRDERELRDSLTLVPNEAAIVTLAG